MRTLNKRNILIGLMAVFCFSACSDQNKSPVTIFFETGDRIQSHPLIENDLLYFGSNDNKLYALDLKTGKKLWDFSTKHNVQSAPVIKDSILFFSNSNSFFALNKNTGDKIWSYTNEAIIPSEYMDPWDYHHGAPVINDAEVYFGSIDGNVYCFDHLSGGLKYTFTTIDSAAIRCNPIVKDNTLYLGDWNGRIYAFDLREKDTLWTHRTYEEQPYPTFGQINTPLYIHDSLLIFGGRNPELQVLNIHTGKVVWKYQEKDGGWISGDPLIASDTLFIGGSDSHKLHAFDLNTGEIFWTYEFLYNSFSKPLIKNDYLFFTTGDAYAYAEGNQGKGYLYALNKSDGSMVNFSLIGGNAFTSPVYYDGKIFAGTDDGNVYAIDLDVFIADSINLSNKGYLSFEKIEVAPNPFQDNTDISFKVNFPAKIFVSINDLNGKELVKLLNQTVDTDTFSINWDGRDSTDTPVADGYYILEINSGAYFGNAFIQKVKK